MLSIKAFLFLSLLFQQAEADKLIWKEAAEIGLENQGWKETLSPYDRLPKSVEKVCAHLCGAYPEIVQALLAGLSLTLPKFMPNGL